VAYLSCENDWEYSLVFTTVVTITGKGSSKHNCSTKQAKKADDGEDNSLLVEDNHLFDLKNTKREIR